MAHEQREYPLFSACGLNCGLCPRYHTNGASRCPGCAGEGFAQKHPPCGVLSCSRRCGVQYCFACAEYPCKRFDGADQWDSFITHKNQLSDLEKAKSIGINAYQAQLNEKVALLEHLLKNYDDGRRKSFFCIAVNLLELKDLKNVMNALDKQAQAPLKQRAAFAVDGFTQMAKDSGIALRLRKKRKA